MIHVLFCGARRLGIDCLKELMRYRAVKIIGAVVPGRDKKKWWMDADEENEARDMGAPCISWTDAKEMTGMDLVFSVLHAPIFTQPFIEGIRCGVINLHPAPLPGYRGCNGPAYAIINREKRFGATLHYVDKGIDTGPIIRQFSLAITRNDTGESLYRRTHDLALRLFKKSLPSIIRAATKGKMVRCVAQDNSKARYYNRTSLVNKEIDLDLSYQAVYDHVRALQFPPFEPSYFVYKNKKIHLNVIRSAVTIVPF